MYSASPTVVFAPGGPVLTKYRIPDCLWVALIACVGGFLNGTGWRPLFGTLTASMTGNFFSMSRATITTTTNVLAISMVWLSFFLAAFVATLFATIIRALAMNYLKNSDSPNEHLDVDRLVGLILFGIDAGLLALVWGLGMRWEGIILAAESRNQWYCVAIGCIMAACAGWQSVALAEAKTFQRWPSTVVVTMNTVLMAVRLEKLCQAYAKKWVGAYARRSISQPAVSEAPTSPRAVHPVDCEQGVATSSLELATTPAAKEQEEAFDFEAEQAEAQAEAEAKEASKAFDAFLEMFLSVSFFLGGVVMGLETFEALSWHCMFIPVTIILIIMMDMLMWQRKDF